MGTSYRSIISLFIVFSIVMSTVACSTTKRVAVYPKFNNGTENLTFDKKLKYEISLKGRASPLQLKGSEVVYQDPSLILYPNTSQQMVYDKSQIVHITKIDNTKGKRMLKGGLVGTAVGAAIFLGAALAKETSTNCGTSSGDPGDCRTMKKVFWGLVPVGTLTFGAAGVGIGALTVPDNK